MNALMSYILPIILVIGVCVGGYLLLMNTPLGKLLNGLLGGADALLLTIESTIRQCFTKKFTGTCVIIAAIAIPLVLGALFVKYLLPWLNKTKSRVLERLAAESNKTAKEVTDDILKEMQEDGTMDEIDKNENFDDNAKEFIKNEIVEGRAQKKLLEKIRDNPNTPENVKEANIKNAKDEFENGQKLRREKFYEENEDLTDEQKDDIDETINEGIPAGE